jgi:hypothetical protein
VSATTNLAQTNNYFKAILDNGYAWISLCEPLSITADNRYNYLVSLLGNQRLRKLSKSNYSLIDCEEDIIELDKSLSKVNRIDLNFMVEMIDKFYENKENLIIPILGAYCYSIKELAGYNENDLEAYRQGLLKYVEKQSE